MSNLIYEFSILYNKRQTSWEFETPQARNTFFDTVKEKFSGKEYVNKNKALGKKDIVQISVNDVRQDSIEGIADIVPYEWYDGEVYNELMEFVTNEYKKY
ncbi:hypothetical protein ACFSTA_12455 [Ornithinibacillus salinisoli]|uniref:Uncharacterized protein n=1 Tax=Ornithinibacillus salinisoli TaxID=1848459 RepID=A0ABW4W595_9BACI